MKTSPAGYWAFDGFRASIPAEPKFRAVECGEKVVFCPSPGLSLLVTIMFMPLALRDMPLPTAPLLFISALGAPVPFENDSRDGKYIEKK